MCNQCLAKYLSSCRYNYGWGRGASALPPAMGSGSAVSFPGDSALVAQAEIDFVCFSNRKERVYSSTKHLRGVRKCCLTRVVLGLDFVSFIFVHRNCKLNIIT